MLIGVRAGLLRCWRGQRPRLGAEACGLVGKSGLPDKACGLRRIVDGGPHRCWPTYCLRREKQGQHAEDATCRMNTGLSAASREPNPSDRCWITADLAALGPAAMSLFASEMELPAAFHPSPAWSGGRNAGLALAPRPANPLLRSSAARHAHASRLTCYGWERQCPGGCAQASAPAHSEVAATAVTCAAAAGSTKPASWQRSR